MKKPILLAAGALLGTLFVFMLFKENPASEFLNALSTEQRNKVVLAFDDPRKEVWHFIPSSMFQREGISIKELSLSQQDQLFSLLQHYLSKSGYEKARKIMDLETVLREFSGDSIMRDPGKYFVSFYGDPAKDDIWAWSFEGHHISLNFAVDGEQVRATPRFFGSNPGMILTGPREGERTLKAEEDLGFTLINALSEAQQKQAIFQEESFRDIVTSNLPEIDPLKPAGIGFEQLDKMQQMMLIQIIDEYLKALPKKQENERRNQIQEEGLDKVYFGWVGAKDSSSAHYYRVQGESFLIEFDNSQNKANHIHTVWRDFNGDFGRDLIKEHYANSDHH